jgi:hypothetical protein
LGNLEGKRPLGRHSRRWEHNIELDLREIGMDWIHVTQGSDQWQALVNATINIRVT